MKLNKQMLALIPETVEEIAILYWIYEKLEYGNARHSIEFKSFDASIFSDKSIELGLFFKNLAKVDVTGEDLK